MKICTFCKIEKPFTEFSSRKDQKDGLHFYCRPCLKEKKAESYQRNRGKALAAMAAYRKANPEKVAAAKKKCYEAKPEHTPLRVKRLTQKTWKSGKLRPRLGTQKTGSTH